MNTFSMTSHEWLRYILWTFCLKKSRIYVVYSVVPRFYPGSATGLFTKNWRALRTECHTIVFKLHYPSSSNGWSHKWNNNCRAQWSLLWYHQISWRQACTVHFFWNIWKNLSLAVINHRLLKQCSFTHILLI